MRVLTMRVCTCTSRNQELDEARVQVELMQRERTKMARHHKQLEAAWQEVPCECVSCEMQCSVMVSRPFRSV